MVARRLADGDRLLEVGAGQRHMALEAVDGAEVGQRVAGHARADALVSRPRRLELPHRLVEAAQPHEGLAPVGRGQRAEQGDPRQVGQPYGLVQLAQGLAEIALRQVARAPVGPDANDLHVVMGGLGMGEGPLVVVHGLAVAVDRSHHPLGRERHGEGPVVPALARPSRPPLR